MRSTGVNAAFIVLVFVVAASWVAGDPPSSTPHPDFSGRWVLDLGRSRLDARLARGLTRGVVRIDHRDPRFGFRRSFTQGGEVSNLSFELATDGKEVEGSEDGMPTRRTLSWSGEALVFVTVYRSPRGEARNTVRYVLSEGGKTLSAEESFRGPRLSYDNVWAFTRGD